MALGLPDEQLLFAFTPDEMTSCQGVAGFRKALFELLDGRLTVSEITARLCSKGYDCDRERVVAALEVLSGNNLLEDYAAGDGEEERGDPELAFGERYSRQLLFFAAWEANGRAAAARAQAALAESRIVLFGLGGFGSHLFYELASLGVGRITVVDFDRVEASNLNRQLLFGEADIDREKIAVGRELAGRLNSQLEYDFISRRITAWEEMAELLEGASCAVLAADSPRDKIPLWMNRAAFATGVPALFTLGASLRFLRLGPLVVPGRTSCYACCTAAASQLIWDDPLVRKINHRYRHGVIAPYVMITAGMMALEIVKHLTGFAPCSLYDQWLEVDALEWRMRKVPFFSCPECAWCGSRAGAGSQPCRPRE
jgi:molybdopterin/thiamine biosynthesis adenylyltransferase